MNDTTSFPFGPPPAPVPGAPPRIAFTGRRGDFSKLVWRGTALERTSLAFDRLWRAPEMPRQLSSDTSAKGGAAGYPRTATEMLIGSLFALAIVAPFYRVDFLLGPEAERLTAFASMPL